MAKPVNQPEQWATTPTYPPGLVYPATYPWGDPHPQAGLPVPWTGQPRRSAAGLPGFAAAGFTPLTPDAADLLNEQEARIVDLARWVFDGTSLPDATAHVVETDAGGVISAQFVSITPTTAGDAGIVTATDGRGLNVTGAGVFAGIETTAIGTGAGLFSQVANGAPAVVGLGTGGNSVGVDGTAHGTGCGVRGTGDQGPGVEGMTSATGAPGVRGTGSANPASSGVEGVAADPAAWGVAGASDPGGGVLGAGVRADGLSDAPGLSAEAEDGYAAALLSGGERAQLRLAPNTGQPPTSAQGDVAYDDGTALQGQLLVRHTAAFEALHSSPLGYVEGLGTLAGAGSTAGGPAVMDSASVRAEVVGDVKIEVSLGVDFDSDTGTATIQIYDLTAAVIIATQPIRARDIDSGAASGRDDTHTLWTRYTLPDTALRTFEARILAGVGTVTWKNAGIVVKGTF
jgi:hypothetical protein